MINNQLCLTILSIVGIGLLSIGIVLTLDIFQNMSKWHPLWYLQFSPMSLCIGVIMIVYVCDQYWKSNKELRQEWKRNNK